MDEREQQPFANNTAQQIGASPDQGADLTSIDIEKLAEKVYQLMCADIRLSQARGQQRNTRK